MRKLNVFTLIGLIGLGVVACVQLAIWLLVPDVSMDFARWFGFYVGAFVFLIMGLAQVARERRLSEHSCNKGIGALLHQCPCLSA